jgi:plastocyanin
MRRQESGAPALELLVAIALLAAGLLTGQPAAQAADRGAGRPHTVTIDALSYSPKTLIVRRGDRITWTNRDPIPHTVTAANGTFDSHSIAPGHSWTYVARKPGAYDYGCAFHVTMKGRLEVH